MCVCACACVCGYVYNVYVSICMSSCVYRYMYVWGCTRMCLCARVGMLECIYVTCICSVVCCSDSDSFVQYKLSNGRFRVVPIMDPIPWQFEDLSMRWSADLYQFMHWRPDNDSISKPRHFMLVFALVLFSLFYHCQYYLYVICIISCDCLRYFTSLVTCITSWDISECSLYLYSWFERLFTSFYVVVGHPYWYKNVCGIQ